MLLIHVHTRPVGGFVASEIHARVPVSLRLLTRERARVLRTGEPSDWVMVLPERAEE